MGGADRDCRKGVARIIYTIGQTRFGGADLGRATVLFNPREYSISKLTRPVLKEFFEKGDKPTQAQFSAISNVLKTKHDTAKNSVANIR